MKKEFITQVKLKRAAVEALRSDYLETLESEVKRVGGISKLAALLGRSHGYIAMTKRGGLFALKNCVEEIAVKLYGWKE